MTTEMAQRKGLRFPAETGTLIQIDLNSDAAGFSPGIVGLVLDEAAKGCAAVIVKNQDVQEGSSCTVKVGRLAPVRAEIKWVRELDSQVLKIGFLYSNDHGCT